MKLGRLCPRCGAFTYGPCCELAGKGRTPRRERGIKVWHSRRFRRLRRVVFARDGYTCRDCGLVDATRTGRSLVAEHEVPFEDEHDPLAWDLANIVTRCARCAGRKDAALRNRPTSPEPSPGG